MTLKAKPLPNPSDELIYSRWFKQVRVLLPHSGPPLYVGMVNELFFDLNKWS